jgi:hypothetical protein
MSTNECDAAAPEAVTDHEKTEIRRNRRPSVQFFDKNLIRRRSSGQEKQQQLQQQLPRLPSIDSNDESEAPDVDRQKHDCENLESNRNSNEKNE